MGFKSFLSKYYGHLVYAGSRRWMEDGSGFQKFTFFKLIHKGSGTQFGMDHDFKSIQSIKDFQEKVPVREYEDFKPYIEKAKAGGKDILWMGYPLYFSTTSGTTSGIKYIPITKESIREQVRAARNALLFYIHHTGKSEFLDGKLIFLSGSPKLNKKGKIAEGRLSGIVNHHIPSYLKSNQLPSFETNCIEDWESKIDSIVEETLVSDLRFISGIPPWVQMYFDRLFEKTGKSIKEIFPNFSLFVYGGVNFEPYRQQLEQRIGKKIPSIETYPASEGFFAFQDQVDKQGLLLLVESGIFYEFIPLSEWGKEHYSRLTLEEVELQVNYALVISTNAGLWAYLVGDTIKFISKNPYRILVTGRIKHFISAFGEHVIGEEVESAIQEVSDQFQARIIEFTVAPQVNPKDSSLPYHEWFVEFGKPPQSLEAFSEVLDKTMQKKNHYYKDLIQGGILRPLILRTVKENTFIQFMKNRGKLGGQNKVPHLSNTREIAMELENILTS